jgi:E3 ubiquitin-protein ligase mind-bomb
VPNVSGEPHPGGGLGGSTTTRPFQAPSSNCRERQAGSGGGTTPGPRHVLSTPNTVTNLHVTANVGPEAAECLVCSELALLVLFSPCQHRTVCEGE